MVDPAEVLQKLKNTNINLQEYWEYFDGSLALPADNVLEDTEKLCNNLNKVMFIFKHVARRNYNGIDVYPVQRLLSQQIKWGADGYSRSNTQDAIKSMCTNDVLVLDKHSVPHSVKEYEVDHVVHILGLVARSTAFSFAEKHTERCTFTDLEEVLKCTMLAMFLNNVDKYGISFSDSQFKLARIYVATRWANRISNKKEKQSSD